ncbi:MAG: DotU family type IV/VI secretion system protein [Planctomycetota bacterium]
MKLSELCEPVLQYVCRLNRSARRGVDLESNTIRADIEQLFRDADREAASDPFLSDQWSKVELALVYFVDFMIKESKLSFASEWRELAHERDKLAGDEEFFDLLEESLGDTSEAGSERLEVFYTCMGLGFTGFYATQPDQLKKKMMEVAARLRRRMETEASARIVPEAYEHVDTSDLIQPPSRGLLGLVVVLAMVAMGVIVGNGVLYGVKAGDLDESLSTITDPSGGDRAGPRDDDA